MFGRRSVTPYGLEIDRGRGSELRPLTTAIVACEYRSCMRQVFKDILSKPHTLFWPKIKPKQDSFLQVLRVIG